MENESAAWGKLFSKESKILKTEGEKTEVWANIKQKNTGNQIKLNFFVGKFSKIWLGEKED